MGQPQKDKTFKIEIKYNVCYKSITMATICNMEVWLMHVDIDTNSENIKYKFYPHLPSAVLSGRVSSSKYDADHLWLCFASATGTERLVSMLF